MGDTANNKLSKNKGLEHLQGLPMALNNGGMADILKGYGTGGMSLEDAIKAMHYDGSGRRKETESQIANLQKMIAQAEGMGRAGEQIGATKELGSWKGQLGDLQKKLHEINSAPEYENAKIMELFSNPLTGTKAASEQVMGNELFGNYFKKGGISDQRQAEESNLASRGYSLQPEDYEAYGQASDNIARTFGSQENMLAQALASRGLSAGASGAAGVGFSGLMGNKLEQLASSQRQIANDRMKMNLERLTAVRGAVDQANQQAQGALNSQRAANQQGIDNHRNTLKDAVTAGQVEQGHEDTRFAQNEATSGPSFGEVLGGIGSAALGGGLGSLAGGLGTGAAASLFGGDAAKQISQQAGKNQWSKQ